MLNELGVEKITFIYCRRSQKSFRPDFRRFERIAESSMQQCGRSERMKFELMEDLGSFLNAYPKTAVLDFCDDVLEDDMEVETVLIGCEGGFSEEERELFSSCKTVRLNTPMILRSESAAVAIAAKILL
jgi:16S rRNA (uracil1498-N3)-methyltransferase